MNYCAFILINAYKKQYLGYVVLLEVMFFGFSVPFGSPLSCPLRDLIATACIRPNIIICEIFLLITIRDIGPTTFLGHRFHPVVSNESLGQLLYPY